MIAGSIDTSYKAHKRSTWFTYIQLDLHDLTIVEGNTKN